MMRKMFVLAYISMLFFVLSFGVHESELKDSEVHCGSGQDVFRVVVPEDYPLKPKNMERHSL